MCVTKTSARQSFLTLKSTVTFPLSDVTLAVPYDVLSYSIEDTEKQAPSVDLKAGTQTLDGDKTVQLLDYYDNPKGETERMDTYLKLVQFCLNPVGSGNPDEIKTQNKCFKKKNKRQNFYDLARISERFRQVYV